MLIRVCSIYICTGDNKRSLRRYSKANRLRQQGYRVSLGGSDSMDRGHHGYDSGMMIMMAYIHAHVIVIIHLPTIYSYAYIYMHIYIHTFELRYQKIIFINIYSY